jgi:mannose-6-phosphate isomerase-like protein (cupin superfamily)
MNTKQLTVKIVTGNEGRRFEVMGATMIYKATTEDTGGAYSLAEETTPPGGGLPLHVHSREDEAMYILEGEYEIQAGERRVRASAGSFVFLPKGVPNGYHNVGGKPGRFLHLTSPGGFERLVEETSRIKFAEPTAMHKVAETAMKFGIEFMGPGPGK